MSKHRRTLVLPGVKPTCRPRIPIKFVMPRRCAWPRQTTTFGWSGPWCAMVATYSNDEHIPKHMRDSNHRKPDLNLSHCIICPTASLYFDSEIKPGIVSLCTTAAQALRCQDWSASAAQELADCISADTRTLYCGSCLHFSRGVYTFTSWG